MMPPAHVPTPAVFSALTTEERGPRTGRGVSWWRRHLTRADVSYLWFNRLTAAATRVCPAVGVLLADLEQQGATGLMSGSGAACFTFGQHAPPAGVTAWYTTTISRAVALMPAEIR